jgi:rod shape-determining protein MreC
MFFRRNSKKPYLILAVFIGMIFILPGGLTRSIRSGVFTLTAPVWTLLHQLTDPFASDEKRIEFERLELENALLRDDPFSRVRISRAPIESTFARVIFRSPATWNRELWIDVGESDPFVAKGSPVVIGASVVGVIDSVGPHRSRVRLLSDSTLVPSVRAARGQKQDEDLLFHLDQVVEGLNARSEPGADLATAEVIKSINRIRDNLKPSANAYLLAKGEVCGAGSPLWRGYRNQVRGIGFNYWFADEEGPARDLKSGAPIPPTTKAATMPILQVGDLLVTTGMDGIFPAGLHVARVEKIESLREGAASFDIEAVPTAGNLLGLTHVYVLPPS